MDIGFIYWLFRVSTKVSLPLHSYGIYEWASVLTGVIYPDCWKADQRTSKTFFEFLALDPSFYLFYFFLLVSSVFFCFCEEA